VIYVSTHLKQFGNMIKLLFLGNEVAGKNEMLLSMVDAQILFQYSKQLTNI